jgi:L-lactate dehydrogenase (cytochrome)
VTAGAPEKIADSTMNDTSYARRLRRILSLDDFEIAAASRLPRPIYAYVSGAAETNRSFRDNRDAYDEYGFTPRVLVDVSRRDTEAELFGRKWSQPFGIAPMGLCALFGYRGDVALATAAAKAGIPMLVSGTALTPLEDVVAANPDAWFQAYLPGETDEVVALVERAANAGYRTLVVTVDTPVAANRENNVRAGFSTPLRPSLRLAWDGLVRPGWLLGTFARTLLTHGMPHFENNYARRGAPVMSSNVLRDFSDRGRLTWEHFAMIRRMWKGPVVLKGILNATDAARGADTGADGIIVSNHGGRQLDGSVAPLRVLPSIVAACPRIPVMVDSGIRRGSDVLKALALGARFVFVGRPFAFSLAVAGEAGALHAAGILGTEVSRNMALLGVTRLDELNAAEHLHRLRP